MVGLGFRAGDKNGDALIIDPYVRYGLSALLRTNRDQERMIMVGVRIGMARRFDRKPITRLERSPRQPDNAW